MDLPTCPAFALLVEWLKEDKRDGVPWEPERFALYLVLACRETDTGRLWRNAILDTYPAWESAYLDDRPGRIQQFGRELLDGHEDDPRFEGVDELMALPGF